MKDLLSILTKPQSIEEMRDHARCIEEFREMRAKTDLRYYVYRFINKSGEVIYVGKTKDIKSRMKTHLSEFGHLENECYKSIDKIEFTCFLNKAEMDIYELHFINKLKPKYNTKDKSDREYRIDLKEVKWVTYFDFIPEEQLLYYSMYISLYNYKGKGEHVKYFYGDEAEKRFSNIDWQFDLFVNKRKQKEQTEFLYSLAEKMDFPEWFEKDMSFELEDILSRVDEDLQVLNTILNT